MTINVRAGPGLKSLVSDLGQRDYLYLKRELNPPFSASTKHPLFKGGTFKVYLQCLLRFRINGLKEFKINDLARRRA
jgi:hypothetical protein